MSTLSDLILHLRALSRIIYVVTEEEDVFLRHLHNLIKRFPSEASVFSQTFGLMPLEGLFKDWKSRAHNPNPIGPGDALDQVYTTDPKNKQCFWIFTDPEILLSDPMFQRRVLDNMHQLNGDKNAVKIIIFLSNRKYIPPKLSRYIQVIEWSLSSEDILKTLAEPLDNLKPKVRMPDRADQLFRGLTTFEIKAAVAQSVIRTAEACGDETEIPPEHIHEFRQQMLRKTGLLEYIDTSSYSMSSVGGLERFKTWVNEMRGVFSEEGRAYGLAIPKGLLLCGCWGTGKSLSAKMLGTEWGLPVVMLEMGKLRSSGVGDTEAAAYHVCRLVESVAPCLLWIDEAEKSLSGGQSSAATDSGTTARTLGIFSTWIQETTVPVTLVLTANRLATLPVEFVNRMDERWFFDLPSADERMEILKIHLAKTGQDPDAYNLLALSEAAKDMVGREIEQCINAAKIKSFHARKPRIDQGIMEAVLRRKPRIVKTMNDEVKEIVDWVGYDAEADDGIRAHFASKPNRSDGKFRGGAFEIVAGGAAKR